MFEGSFTALVTPFRDNGVDASAFQDFVRWQIAEGTHGLVPCGTTGESPTLDLDEHIEVVRLCIEAAEGRAPVVAGIGSNDTATAVHLARAVEKVGADAALLVTPYYNKPNQEGLYAHFKTVHDSCGIPIVIYNIPGRCIVDMTPETMGALAQLPRIAGVKDATSDIPRVKKQAAACGGKFEQLSGDDSTAVAFAKEGGVGAISVTSNIAPRACAEMWNAIARKDWATAERIDDTLYDLHRTLFMDPSPGPAKYCLSLMGKMTPDLRLPLTPPSDATRAKLRAAMDRAGVKYTA
jgi:4-hydroxy-tetrahydrodipicolinate synthase